MTLGQKVLKLAETFRKNKFGLVQKGSTVVAQKCPRCGKPTYLTGRRLSLEMKSCAVCGFFSKTWFDKQGQATKVRTA